LPFPTDMKMQGKEKGSEREAERVLGLTWNYRIRRKKIAECARVGKSVYSDRTERKRKWKPLQDVECESDTQKHVLAASADATAAII